MAEVARELLESYLDDALSEKETAQVEQALRESEALRGTLRSLMIEMDRGDHSLGAVWRRNHLTCPSRDQLGSFLLGALDDDYQEYIEFHLATVGCSFCNANLEDLRSMHRESSTAKQRRQRIFDSSAGLLRPNHNRGM